MPLDPAHTSKQLTAGAEDQVIAAGARRALHVAILDKPGLGSIVFTYDGSEPTTANGTRWQPGMPLEAPGIPQAQGDLAHWYDGEVRALYLGDSGPSGDGKCDLRITNTIETV